MIMQIFLKLPATTLALMLFYFHCQFFFLHAIRLSSMGVVDSIKSKCFSSKCNVSFGTYIISGPYVLKVSKWFALVIYWKKKHFSSHSTNTLSNIIMFWGVLHISIRNAHIWLPPPKIRNLDKEWLGGLKLSHLASDLV